MAGHLGVTLSKWVGLLVVGLGVLALSGQTVPAAARDPSGLSLSRRSLGAPVVAPVALDADPAAVILSYLNQERDDDPLIQVSGQVWAKTSNFSGVMIGGQVFYYRLLGDASFDPLSRGAVSEHDVVVWQVIDDGDSTIVLYMLAPATPHQA
jgi:hypothetical protein